MAHSKSAQKRININKRNKSQNSYYVTSTKRLIKKFFTVLKDYNNSENSNEISELQNLLNLIYSFLDKGAKKKVFHKKFVARKKSQLSTFLKKSSVLL